MVLSTDVCKILAISLKADRTKLKLECNTRTTLSCVKIRPILNILIDAQS
jgi:hypothetical protein